MKTDTKGYDRILQNILAWAKPNENVRAVVLIGSRARMNMKADEWSDTDIIIVVRDTTDFEKSDSWASLFGKPVISFFERTFDGFFEHRVLYEGMLDTDFIVATTGRFLESLDSGEMRKIQARGYVLLLDKEGFHDIFEKTRAPGLGAISDVTIENEIRDYFFHCVWITKKLNRGELWIAMNCLNCYMKGKLLSMIETHTRLTSKEETDVWFEGRFIEKWAGDRIVFGLKGCFADYDEYAIRSALIRQMELFNVLAAEVVKIRNIAYPVKAKDEITRWIKRVDG